MGSVVCGQLISLENGTGLAGFLLWCGFVMNPEEATPAVEEKPAFSAPPRAVRLEAKQPLTDEERAAIRKARQLQEAASTPQPLERAFLEKKLAGLHDAHDILRVLDTELALQRAVRESGAGGKSRQAMRVLSVTVLFALLIAALAAMGWLQSRLAQTGYSRHRTEAKAESGR